MSTFCCFVTFFINIVSQFQDCRGVKFRGVCLWDWNLLWCVTRFGTICTIYKNVKNTCNFTKINTPPWVFFTFFKLYKWYQITQRTTIILDFPLGFWVIRNDIYTIVCSSVAAFQLYIRCTLKLVTCKIF